MKIIIAGGTGFIGKHLINHWHDKYDIAIIGRSKDKIKKLYPNLEAISWDQVSAKLLNSAYVVVNLVGANIGAKTWSDARKKALIDSRIDTTMIIANALATLKENSPLLLNASAIGSYDLQADAKDNTLPRAFDEDTSIDFSSYPNFLTEIGRKWEQATHIAVKAQVRVINLRFGIVLAKEGGALQKMALPFYFGLGGKIGSGQQVMSWIHIDDVIKAIDFLIKSKDIYGPVNLVSPKAVTQMQFAKALGAVLHRPTFMPTPAFMLKAILGQLAEELLLQGQHVYPKRLIDAGFEFKYAHIKDALAAALSDS